MIMNTDLSDSIEHLVNLTIPIYTTNHPNPTTGQADCPIKQIHKDGKRYMLRHKIVQLLAEYDQSAEDKA